jgi:hypothetical protein
MSTDVAHPRRWQIAEVIFGVPFLVAIALQTAVPFSLRRGFLKPAFILGGAALIVVGVALVVLARRELAQRGQPTDPGLPTTKVLTTARTPPQSIGGLAAPGTQGNGGVRLDPAELSTLIQGPSMGKLV